MTSHKHHEIYQCINIYIILIKNLQYPYYISTSSLQLPNQHPSIKTIIKFSAKTKTTSRTYAMAHNYSKKSEAASGAMQSNAGNSQVYESGDQKTGKTQYKDPDLFASRQYAQDSSVVDPSMLYQTVLLLQLPTQTFLLCYINTPGLLLSAKTLISSLEMMLI